ncbi:FtsX-like permease family protein [Brevibacillus fluminis]|uniref:FtsX-like permease family protein n=1 Tax=Brevibacillus fluminis TaxID=511487 RepID=A0A3M8DYR9_9BACL|nr:ABC transporter permease [Brevibacillus fluminis]RNB92381.1 FtsX-like permease family protein [Brevibacillus fluminis]
MNLWESFRSATEGIWANKLRSGLTMLGIIIGITSVIAVTTLGQGGQQAVVSELEKFGTNTFNVFVKWDSTEEAKDTDLQLEDADILARTSPYIDKIVPINSWQNTIRGPKKEVQGSFYGSTEDYLALQPNIKVVKGRFYSSEDTKESRSVIVLDTDMAKDLFGNQNPLGQRVVIGSSSLVVIGVVQESKFRFDQTQIHSAYLPITVLQELNDTHEVGRLAGKAKSKTQLQQAMKQTEQYLNRKHEHKNHYMVSSMEQELAQFNQMTGMLTLVFGVIAGISLLVGGIGVMNIMLVSVTERTREIGIRKALGAKRRDILTQFLIESIIVCLIGGVIGMLLGSGCAMIISHFAGLPPMISWESVAISFGFSSAMGIFFGLYPANKAAKLNPIEALRYE